MVFFLGNDQKFIEGGDVFFAGEVAILDASLGDAFGELVEFFPEPTLVTVALRHNVHVLAQRVSAAQFRIAAVAQMFQHVVQQVGTLFGEQGWGNLQAGTLELGCKMLVGLGQNFLELACVIAGLGNHGAAKGGSGMGDKFPINFCAREVGHDNATLVQDKAFFYESSLGMVVQETSALQEGSVDGFLVYKTVQSLVQFLGVGQNFVHVHKLEKDSSSKTAVLSVL